MAPQYKQEVLISKQEIWVQLLGWEDPLEKGTATHCSVLARGSPMDGRAWWAAVPG